MDKYINSTKVLNFIQDGLNHEDKISDTEKATLIAIQRYIERIQIEDVAPVIHGTLKYSPQDDTALCSKCGEEIYLGALHQFAHNYCPSCGAKMDGEENE